MHYFLTNSIATRLLQGGMADARSSLTISRLQIRAARAGAPDSFFSPILPASRRTTVESNTAG